MFTKTAEFYDAIYTFKDYETEAQKLRALIKQHKQSQGNSLLDVTCGTGKHLALLREHCDVEGLVGIPRRSGREEDSYLQYGRTSK